MRHQAAVECVRAADEIARRRDAEDMNPQPDRCEHLVCPSCQLTEYRQCML